MTLDLQKKIDRIIQAIGRIEPGTVRHVSIKHDDDCPALITQRLTDCTCNPDVERLDEKWN